jgi:hypothetical protein
MSKENPVVLRFGADDPAHKKDWWCGDPLEVIVSCPLCGLQRTMPLEIRSNGDVVQPYKCGYHCAFSDFIRLEGWDHGHRPMDVAWIRQSKITAVQVAPEDRSELDDAVRELAAAVEAAALRRSIDRKIPPL